MTSNGVATLEAWCRGMEEAAMIQADELDTIYVLLCVLFIYVPATVIIVLITVRLCAADR